MLIPTRTFWILLLVAMIAAASAFFLFRNRSNQHIDRGAMGSSFPRYTVEPDGSISKELPKLSATSLARIASRQLKQLVFGINPVVLETANTASDIGRVVFTVENKPSDIMQEYEEYFTAIGWTYARTDDPRVLTVSNAGTRTVINIAPRESGGSLLAIIRSEQR